MVGPDELAANRRRIVRLCAWTAIIPALLLFALLTVTVGIIAGVIAFVVAAGVLMYSMWRLSPRLALRRIGAQPADEDDDPRLFNVTEGLCATFGLPMPDAAHPRRPRAQCVCPRPRTPGAPTWSSRPAC